MALHDGALRDLVKYPFPAVLGSVKAILGQIERNELSWRDYGHRQEEKRIVPLLDISLGYPSMPPLPGRPPCLQAQDQEREEPVRPCFLN